MARRRAARNVMRHGSLQNSVETRSAPAVSPGIEAAPSRVAVLIPRFIETVFRILLGREPDIEALKYFERVEDPETILKAIAASPEYRRNHPLWHYAATFDTEAVVRRYAREGLVPHPDFVTNFIGLRLRPEYMPAVLYGMRGTVEGAPYPGNWHADIAEWAAAFRAVDLAQDTFTVAELGCGWGCWMANTGLAARSRGLRPILLGVEGDPGHLAFARDCFELNGFQADQVDLRHGVATAEPGVALFPRQGEAGGYWDLAPIFDASAEQVTSAGATGEFDALDQVPLADLISDRRLDLLHIDIQGGEADLIEATISLLRDRVGYIVIGTHSREIEGRLIRALGFEGWQLEVERPALVRLDDRGPVTTIDGVQGWRNKRLTSI